MDPIIYDSFAALPQSQILDIGEQTKDRYPDAWHNAHNGDPESGTEFVRRWADACRQQGIYAGNNGKRGGDVLSQDVLTFPVRTGGAHDTSGRFDQIAICDCIVGAGGPNPSLGLGDVSAASQGRFIDPWVLEEGSGGGGGGTTPPTGPGTPPPVISRAEWEQLVADIQGLKAQVEYTNQGLFNHTQERPSTNAHIDDVKRMIAGEPRDPAFTGGTE